VKRFEMNSPVIAALPSSSRYQFVLLEESGKVTFCDV
jgi:hypothetical protein